MTRVIYKFEIPDPSRPTLSEDLFGPSGTLMPFVPPSLDAADVVDRVVEEISTCVGTYGMGGPGFFGLRFGHEWLVIAIWGASEWISVNHRLVTDTFGSRYGRHPAWISECDELSKRLVGSRIRSLEVRKHSLSIAFSTGDQLEIEEDSSNRPILEGSKEPRAFAAIDDLRAAVFLSPTSEIWV